MQFARAYYRDLIETTTANWNCFWFTPADPATLALMRILAGAMLCYTQAVWMLDLQAFFGADSWLNRDVVGVMQRGGWQWSHLWWCESSTLLWTSHLLSMLACLMFTIGLWTRVTSIITCLFVLSYSHRVPDALYGLDQVNAFLVLYLSLGPCGAMYSIDHWLTLRKATGNLVRVRTSIAANISIRLIQWHLCVLYLFAGLSKLQGASWWDGTAFWGAVANYEYQSLDMVWLVHYPELVNFITHITVAWEVTYIALIWGRLSRPIVLALAIPLHLGIGICLGMMTFGLAALIANLAFVSPVLIRSLFGPSLDIESAPSASAPVANTDHVLSGPNWNRQGRHAATRRN